MWRKFDEAHMYKALMALLNEWQADTDADAGDRYDQFAALQHACTY